MVKAFVLLFGAMAALNLGSVTALEAQNSATVRSNSEKPFCFRGRALPRCRAFAITEFGADVRLYAPKTELQYVSSYDSSVIVYSFRPTVFSVTGEVGAMFNANKRNALGGTVFCGMGVAEHSSASKRVIAAGLRRMDSRWTRRSA